MLISLPEFDNHLRALYNIDAFRLPEFNDDTWVKFRDNPVHFWLTCDDTQRSIIWREVQHRIIQSKE